MVSIRDVARRAGVSHQTVSNALNAPDVVSVNTRMRILKAIEELGYKPNAAARRLRSGRSDVLAVGIATAQDRAPSPIFDEFLHLLAAHSSKQGRQIMLYPRTDEQAELQYIQSLMEQSDVDAIILNELEVNDTRPQWLLAHQQPFVLFGRPWALPADVAQRIPWVDVDGKSAITEMVHRLAAAGRKHIGFIGWESGTGTASDRYQGWIDGLRECGLLITDSHADGSNTTDGTGDTSSDNDARSSAENSAARDSAISSTGVSDEQASWAVLTREAMTAGEEAARILFTRHPDLDAIVCCSDNLAVGALSSISRMVKHDVLQGAATPDRLQRPVLVTGFDNSALAKAFSFPSIRQPLDKVVEELLHITDHVIANGMGSYYSTGSHLLAAEVVWRESPYLQH